MHIRQKRVLNVENYLALIPKGSFRVSFNLPSNGDTILEKAGFRLPVKPGDTILPSPIGPVSSFNADGKWTSLKDQPKESRYIRTVLWTRIQWAGRNQTEEITDERDIFRDCYPREFNAPPSVELTYAEFSGRRLIISPVYQNSETRHGEIRHVINLFLELFGECELISEALAPFVKAEVRRVHWKLLPPGEQPWEQLESHIKQSLKRYSSRTQKVIMDRAKTIKGFGPDMQVIGLGGFADYVAYIFSSKGLVLLESIKRDNAIYIFGEDWEQFSQLSKAEILNENCHLHRVIHAKGWQGRVAYILENAKVKPRKKTEQQEKDVKDDGQSTA